MEKSFYDERNTTDEIFQMLKAHIKSLDLREETKEDLIDRISFFGDSRWEDGHNPPEIIPPKKQKKY